MLKRRLERRKFEVVVATNGQEAFALAKSELPDLILMDVGLPIMDGYEATRQIKATAETKAIPVIALTAHAMAEHRDMALSAGCDEYETKPVELNILLEKMQKLLQARVSP
jgi:CheY-like chemotaxis protein